MYRFRSLSLALLFVAVTVLPGVGHAAVVSLYFSEGGPGGLRSYDVATATLSTVISGPGKVNGLALDAQAGRVYWVQEDPDSVRAADLDGSNPMTLDGGSHERPRFLGHDPVHGKVYWGDRTANRLRVANTDGTAVAQRTLHKNLDAPFDAAVDPAGGKVYWTEWEGHRIRRSNLDGSSIENIINLPSNHSPHHLVLDHVTQKIYWTVSDAGKIQRANFDGSQIEDVILGLTHPQGIAIDPYDQRVYWTDNTENVIYSSTYAGTDQRVELSGLNRPNSVDLILSNPTIPAPLAVIPGAIALGTLFNRRQKSAISCYL